MTLTVNRLTSPKPSVTLTCKQALSTKRASHWQICGRAVASSLDSGSGLSTGKNSLTFINLHSTFLNSLPPMNLTLGMVGTGQVQK